MTITLFPRWLKWLLLAAALVVGIGWPAYAVISGVVTEIERAQRCQPERIGIEMVTAQGWSNERRYEWHYGLLDLCGQEVMDEALVTFADHMPR